MGFKDVIIVSSCCVIDLIDGMKFGFICYNMVVEGEIDEDKLFNVKYVIFMGWKIGVKLYVLFEDLVEVKVKMVLIVFVCMMVVDYVFFVVKK